MSSQAAFHRGCILTLVALFSFIICVFQGNIYIIPTFTNVVIFYILIHDQRVVNVVPWVMSISNWENEDCGLEERTNESERQRCKKRQICQIYLCYFLELTFELSMQQAPVLVYCSAISTIPIITSWNNTMVPMLPAPMIWWSDLRQNWPLPFLMCQNLTE